MVKSSIIDIEKWEADLKSISDYFEAQPNLEIRVEILAKMLNGTIPWEYGCYLRDEVYPSTTKECIK